MKASLPASLSVVVPPYTSIRKIGEEGRNLAVQIFSALGFSAEKGVENGINVNNSTVVVRYCNRGSMVNQIRSVEKDLPMMVLHAPSNTFFFGKGSDFYDASGIQHSRNIKMISWNTLSKLVPMKIYKANKKGYSALKAEISNYL